MKYRVFYPSGKRLLFDADEFVCVDDSQTGPIPFLLVKTPVRIAHALDFRAFIYDENGNLIHNPRNYQFPAQQAVWFASHLEWPSKELVWKAPFEAVITR